MSCLTLSVVQAVDGFGVLLVVTRRVTFGPAGEVVRGCCSAFLHSGLRPLTSMQVDVRVGGAAFSQSDGTRLSGLPTRFAHLSRGRKPMKWVSVRVVPVVRLGGRTSFLSCSGRFFLLLSEIQNVPGHLDSPDRPPKNRKFFEFPTRTVLGRTRTCPAQRGPLLFAADP
jgi:hypothetical protein